MYRQISCANSFNYCHQSRVEGAKWMLWFFISFWIKLIFVSSSFDSIEMITSCANRIDGYEAPRVRKSHSFFSLSPSICMTKASAISFFVDSIMKMFCDFVVHVRPQLQNKHTKVFSFKLFFSIIVKFHRLLANVTESECRCRGENSRENCKWWHVNGFINPSTIRNRWCKSHSQLIENYIFRWRARGLVALIHIKFITINR